MQKAFDRYQQRLRPSGYRSSSSSSSSLYWWVVRGADCSGTQYDDGACNGANVTDCQLTCQNKKGCAGFNTHGVLKNTLCGTPGSITPGADCNGCVDLWLLKDTPPPPSGILTSVTVCLATDSDVLGPHTNETYSLSIPNQGIGSIQAVSMYGALRAMESFTQLLDVFGVPKTVRQISGAPIYIYDQPRYSYRGLLVDTSRHFLPVSTLKHVIDGLSYNKMNLLHWHIVDQNSFPCGSNTYPQLALKGAYSPSAIYSPEAMREIVQYAQERGVRVLPEWDIPGHGGWGPGLPQIMACPGVLDPTVDVTYDVMKAFLTEMSGIFSEEWMFLGGDEVDTSCWDNNPSVAAWLKAHNMSSSQLQQYFWQQMQQRVLPYINKTIGVWENDALQIDLSSLPKGAFVNVYQSLSTATKTVSANKTTVVSIAGDWWYLDQLTCSTNGGYHQNGWTCTYDVNPQISTWSPEQASHLKGGEVCMWGEGINKDNLDQYVWRGAGAAAERLWSAQSATMSHVGAQDRYMEHICRLSLLGIHVGPIEPNYCPSDSDENTNKEETTEEKQLKAQLKQKQVALDILKKVGTHRALSEDELSMLVATLQQQL
eukprot:PhF_6_TR26080/c1_g1_i2/m.36822/K12373/HEXA_B; hexosaminidase